MRVSSSILHVEHDARRARVQSHRTLPYDTIAIELELHPTRRRLGKDDVEPTTQAIAWDHLQAVSVLLQDAAIREPPEDRIAGDDRRRHTERRAKAKVDFPVVVPGATRLGDAAGI